MLGSRVNHEQVSPGPTRTNTPSHGEAGRNARVPSTPKHPSRAKMAEISIFAIFQELGNLRDL